jgi:MFS family permease
VSDEKTGRGAAPAVAVRQLDARAAMVVFAAFAVAYFLSALIRAVTATLAPLLTTEFGLHARDLGLLSGAYFLGFSLTQLPLGTWLDRHGPRRVVLGFLSVAVLGCLAFSIAGGFWSLFAARVLCGVGLSACLMAPLTGYRRWLSTAAQLRANSWMLMTGSFGMIASTLPVQWLLPVVGWRGMFVGLAGCLLLAMILIRWQVPAWGTSSPGATPPAVFVRGYADVWRNAYFRAMAPVGFFCYGGLLAIQTLWAAPWMSKVGGYSASEAAAGLFWINVSMLCAFWAWGIASPWMAARRLSAHRLIAVALPASFVVLAFLIVTAPSAGAWSGVLLALYCVACSAVTPSQPAVGMAFPAEQAGRALSAYNLVIFVGVFVIQWGIGLAHDVLVWLGASTLQAMQLAFGIYLLCGVGAYLHLLASSRHNRLAPSP